MSDETFELSGEMNVLDEAIAEARERRARKPSGSREKLSDEEREALRAQKQAERAAAKANRSAAREAKRAEKLANRGPAHLKKVETAGARLPVLDDSTQMFYNDITTNVSRDQVAALSAHLAHFNRLQATLTAASGGLSVAVGDEVTITGGDPRFVGMVGTIARAQRIRCYVTVPGVKKDVYCFISDVSVNAPPGAQTGTDG